TMASVRNNNNSYRKLNDRLDMLKPYFDKEGLLYYDIVDKYRKPVDYANAVGYALEGLAPEKMTPDLLEFMRNAELELNFAGNEMSINPEAQFGAFKDPLEKLGASITDLAANAAGLQFWTDILNGNLAPDRFEIC